VHSHDAKQSIFRSVHLKKDQVALDLTRVSPIVKPAQAGMTGLVGQTPGYLV
jgi:hypothetical protein